METLKWLVVFGLSFYLLSGCETVQVNKTSDSGWVYGHGRER